MKSLALRLLSLAILASISFSLHAQEGAPDILVSVKGLKDQQAQIAENEAKIEAKVADLTETVRLARIYTSRLGRRHKVQSP